MFIITPLKDHLANLPAMIMYKTVPITVADTSVHYLFIPNPINESVVTTIVQDVSATSNADQHITTWIQAINIENNGIKNLLIRYYASAATSYTYDIRIVFFY